MMCLSRRQSFLAGHCESVFWRQTNHSQCKRIVLAAKKFERSTREPGQRNGALGSIALELLELFANLVDFKSGRLEPAITTIMRMLKRSKDAIVRALSNLQKHGFLEKIRRFVRTRGEGRGPQIKQTSNAYRLLLPAAAERLLGILGQPCPPPEDFAPEPKTWLKELPLSERPLAIIGDDRLSKALSRLGSFIQERESARRGESQSTSIKAPGG